DGRPENDAGGDSGEEVGGRHKLLQQIALRDFRSVSRKSRKFPPDFPNLFQENAVLGEETICLAKRSVYNDMALVEGRAPGLAPISDPFFVTAAIAGGASMITTSQNRIAVNQANSVNVRGQVLVAAVVHPRLSSMRPYMTRRTRLPFGTTPAISDSKRRQPE